ncbi:MAG TPA: NAD(P) transhydrogenase subunit alpha [Clostridiales bacterium]|jgi:NAD(P) transhydrogenase subunit alpha|nr:NAD(P) transhydrogenase subunit alpha [Clostridiales bacterium]
MIIGVPKEIMHDENRVSATPEVCARYIAQGHTVLVEHDAGEGSFFHDDQYQAAGAELVQSAKEIYDRADLILKVKEPLFNEELAIHEVDMMRPGQYLITFIHPAAPANHQMVKHLAERGVIALTLDGVPRISRAQSMDALTSMSTCAGYKGTLMGANLLPRFVPQIFSAVGMIKPINALIIGVGVGGLQALATIKRLGARVFAADIRPAAREQAQSLGAKVIELNVPEEAAVGEGGYAKSLSPELLKAEREALAAHLPEMDFVFLSALVPGKLAPVLITEDMVKQMKPGAVIVDISIDQGGNCELTPPGETALTHNVHIVGIKNIPGLLPESATSMFALNMYNLVNYLVKDGQFDLNPEDEIVQGILTTRDGQVVHQGAREAMGL